MTATTAPPTTGPHYYASFAGYEVPFRPDEPVSFADTEGRAAYCIAYRDRDGRVTRFDKILLVRDPDQRSFSLDDPLPAGEVVYFGVTRDPAAPADPRPGDRIEFSQTEHLTEFFAGEVDASGDAGTAVLFRRQTAFSDVYDYWPGTDRLRTRTLTRAGAADPSVWQYDRAGRMVTDAPAEEAEDDTLDLVVTGAGVRAAASALLAVLESVPGVRAEQPPANLPGEIAPLTVTALPDALARAVEAVAAWVAGQPNSLVGYHAGFHGLWANLGGQAADELAALIARSGRPLR